MTITNIALGFGVAALVAAGVLANPQAYVRAQWGDDSGPANFFSGSQAEPILQSGCVGHAAATCTH